MHIPKQFPADFRQLLRELLSGQKLAVLSTHNGGQPYASLVAFAFSDDLGSLYFVTPRTTRKFSNRRGIAARRCSSPAARTRKPILTYLADFAKGDILVCDAVDPNMTFVVPLAAAVVERRGGMLIHGAIIARECGLPCVTGVPDASVLIPSGVPLTVGGYLGIVTIGSGRI